MANNGVRNSNTFDTIANESALNRIGIGKTRRFFIYLQIEFMWLVQHILIIFHMSLHHILFEYPGNYFQCLITAVNTAHIPSHDIWTLRQIFHVSHFQMYFNI